MRIIPKFQNGGVNYDLFFSLYAPKEPAAEKAAPAAKKEKDKDDGKLTLKDFFNLISSMDGLLNEMLRITNKVKNIFDQTELVGIELTPAELSSHYIDILYDLKTAKNNKDSFLKAFEHAEANGSLQEPAITLDGSLLCLNSKGDIVPVTMQLYIENKNVLLPLTVSLLANLREYDPSLINNYKIIDVINNSVGFEYFNKTLKEAISSLGSTETKQNKITPLSKAAAAGLQLLGSLTADERLAVLEGSVETTTITKNQLEQIKSLKAYLLETLPNKAKSWAAFKLGTEDPELAINVLITQYLSSMHTNSFENIINYKEFYDRNKESVKSSNSSSSTKEPDYGSWSQLQAGLGGTDTTFLMINGEGNLTVDAKFYGKLDGLTEDMSLQQLIGKMGGLRVDNKNITIGDKLLSTESYNDVMIVAASGGMTATLPKNADGSVNYDIVEEYTVAKKKVLKRGIKEDNPQFAKEMGKELKDMDLDLMIDANGNLNMNMVGHFLILDAVASSKTKYMGRDNKPHSIDSADTPYIRKDDKSADRLIHGLSGKDSATNKYASYELDRDDWFDIPSWFGYYDKTYKANIYIPINLNPINGYNADENNIKRSLALNMEQATLFFERRRTSSSMLQN